MIFLLIGYLLLAAALVFIILFFRRKKAVPEAEDKQPASQVYPRQDCSIPHADRILEDAGPSLKDSDMEELKDRLCNVLEREKLYLNPDIRVGDLAERLYTNKSYLAQTIKIKLNKNFCQLVHYYRVREAMRLYAQNPELTITQL